MRSRARKTASDEDGFIIIEVLVSALILAIVAGAVLTLITATTRGAAVQRAHAVGYDLAQEDQARMRTMRIPGLNAINPNEPRTVTVGTTAYTVKSKADFVPSPVGQISCSAGASRDYIQLTSTVTGGEINPANPVILQSAVSPSSGSIDTEHGALLVQTLNAAGKPIAGVTVTLSPGGATATTETQGCANFPELGLKTYTPTLEASGLIGQNGTSVQRPKEVTVTANSETPARVETTYWDRPATIEPEFVYLEPGTGTLRPAPVDSMWVVNPTYTSAQKWFGTPGTGPRTSILSDKAIYPFKGSEYTVYAGSCETNYPGTAPANVVGLFSKEVSPGAVLKPQIHVPALELTVTTKEGTEGKEGKELVVAGAKVTLTDTKCKSGNNNVKRTFWTNAGGHLSNEKAVKEDPAKAPTEAGLPFGTYEVCASATINGELRKATFAGQKVEDFSSNGATLKLNLVKGTTEC